MNDKATKEKIEKSIDLICPLYENDLITDAFIVGSVAKGTAKPESDIDIILVNPIMLNAADLPPLSTVLPYTQSKEEEQLELLRLLIVNTLKGIGVEFKEIELKDIILWYQLYKCEIFHIMTRRSRKDVTPDSIEIKRDVCKRVSTCRWCGATKVTSTGLCTKCCRF